MALVQQNLVPATGDHLVTLDTETNLEWLSLNATANLSYLEVLGGAGGYTTTYGFRYATGQEIGLLWQHAGITKYGRHPCGAVPSKQSRGDGNPHRTHGRRNAVPIGHQRFRPGPDTGHDEVSRSGRPDSHHPP
jgi:hypothetical protein